MYTNEVAACANLDELNRAIQVQRRRLDAIAPRSSLEETAATITLNPSRVPPKPVAKATRREVSDLDRLDALQSQSILVANIAVQLKTDFVGQRLAVNAVKAVQALQADVDGRMQALRRKLTDAARDSKRISRGLVQANHSVHALVAADFKGRYAKVVEGYLLSPVRIPGVDGAVDAEVGYTLVKEFKGDDGNTNPELWIVTARPTKGAGDKFWVATVTSFKVPEKIRWERSAKSGVELTKVVRDLLAEDGVIGKAFPREVPLTPDQLKFVHDNVRSSRIEGGAIVVQVINRKRLQETRLALRSQLAGLVRSANAKNRDVIRDSAQQDKGTIRFVFTLPKSMHGRIVSKEKLTQIGNMLSLTPADLKRVQSAIEDAE